MKTLRDRVAVITGAGGGLGTALAVEFASRGCHLALCDISEEALTRCADRAANSGVQVSTHVVDVSDGARMTELPGQITAIHRRIDLLVNNAGITLQKQFTTHSIADWQRMIGINLWGVIHGCHFFYEELCRSGDAHVVNLSSMAAFVGLPSQSSYCATKSGIQGLSEALWAEWAVDGIGVTSVHPGAIRTEMIQATLAESDDPRTAQRNYELAQRMGVDAEHAARKIVTAILKGRMRVRIGKDAVLMDWLKRVWPGAIHRVLRRVARGQA